MKFAANPSTMAENTMAMPLEECSDLGYPPIDHTEDSLKMTVRAMCRTMFARFLSGVKRAVGLLRYSFYIDYSIVAAMTVITQP